MRNILLTSTAAVCLMLTAQVAQAQSDQQNKKHEQKVEHSQKAPDALLKVGYCEYEMKKWDQAEATLNQVVQKYPDTTVARLAQGRLRALKLEARH